MADNIDLTAKAITFLFRLPGENRLDLRIALALLEKVTIFLLFFISGGESRFSFFDYSLSLIGWFIMHVQIVAMELGYIRSGENNLMKRYFFFQSSRFSTNECCFDLLFSNNTYSLSFKPSELSYALCHIN
jgi:hypothetical protein